MGFLIEYDGDDTDILADAVRRVANGKWVCRVMLNTGTIPSVADYVLSDLRPDGTVLLTLVDVDHDAETRRPDLSTTRFTENPDGKIDSQIVNVHDIVELHVY